MQKTVSVRGEVYYPGSYSILGPNDNLTDIIDRVGGGGLRPNVHGLASKFSRKTKTFILTSKLSKNLNQK